MISTAQTGYDLFPPGVARPTVVGNFLLFIACFVFGSTTAYATDSRTIERMIEATEVDGQKLDQEQREDQRKLGKLYYHRFCIHCHGAQGKGDGSTAAYLSPSPRDLSLGLFKFRSTSSNTLPLDQDLIKTIKRGIPGSAMPAWDGVFEEDVVRALVEYIKLFSSRFQFASPDFIFESGLQPPYNALSVETGQRLYRELRCVRCHGEKGEKHGEVVPGNDIHHALVYDLRKPGFYKAGASAKEIVNTLATGMDGTPMSAYDYLADEERWHLAHFLQSRFIQAPSDAPVATLAGEIVSTRVQEHLDIKFSNSIWTKANKIDVPLFGFKARQFPRKMLTVQSVHNEKKIAFKLTWKDLSANKRISADDFYLDSVALQFPMVPSSLLELPFWGMGEKGKPVNIWHWKADGRQFVGEESGRSIPASTKGNSSALDPFRESAVEEINAAGFGTLSVQTLEDQQLEGQGRWVRGQWEVIFLRDLKTSSPNDAGFESPGNSYFSLALWDGRKLDRNASKRISLWQKLILR